MAHAGTNFRLARVRGNDNHAQTISIPGTAAFMPAIQLLLILAAICGTGAGVALWWRRSEIRALERALYPEIISMRFQARALATEIARQHAAGPPLDAAFFWQWRLSAPLVYPAAAQRLGLLPGDAPDRIGHFHAQLAEARARLAEVRSAGMLPAPYRLLSNLMRASNHVEPWVRARQPRFGAMPGDHPDMAEAHALLDTLEDGVSEPVAHPWFWADCCARDEPDA